MRTCYLSVQSTAGFSMISLLIGMVLAAVLLNGLISVFSSNQNTSRLMFDFGSLQENIRTADDMLEVSLRQAGHFGGVNPADISTHSALAITGKGLCNQAWITDTTLPIRGFDGANLASNINGLPTSCIDDAYYVSGTDVLALKYASTMDMAPINALDGNTVYIRTIVGSSAESIGQIFKGSDGPTIGDTTDPIGTYNYRFMSELYYVRACSQKRNGVCQNDVPSLMRLQLDGTTYTEHLVVEGVEQFQVEFGLDTDGNLAADRYASPASVHNWQQVVSVRFSLVIRGTDKDRSITDNKTYNLAGNTDYTPTSNDQAYRRRAYTKVIQLRNMIRG